MTRIISLLTMMCSIFGCSAQDNGFTSLSVDDFEKARVEFPFYIVNAYFLYLFYDADIMRLEHL